MGAPTKPRNVSTQSANVCQQNIHAAMQLLEKFPEARLFPCVWDGTHKPRIRWKSETPATQPKAAWSETLNQWATQFGPNTYFCIALRESGLCVVDVDVKHNKDGETTLTSLLTKAGSDKHLDTFCVQTPSGGKHYYFAGSVHVTKANALGPGVDIPGMVPVPGTYIVGKGTYTPMNTAAIAPLPAWVSAALPQRDKNTTPNNSATTALDNELDILRAIRFLEDRDGAIEGRGGDAYTYQTAAKLRDMGISESVAFALMYSHWNPKCQPAWSFAELREKVRNAYKYATGQPGADSVTDAFEPVNTTDPIIESLIQQKAKLDKPALLEKSIMKASELMQMPTTKRKMLLHPWLTTKSIGMVYAPRGVGKSWFALGIAAAVASGTSFGPWEAPMGRKARVLYWDGELPMEDLIERAKQLGLDKLDNLYLLSSDVFRTMAEQHGVTTSTPKLSQEWFQYIYHIVKKLKIDLIIIDNLASLLVTGDENDRQSWVEVNTFLLELRWLGAAAMFIHHAGKSGAQRGTSSREDTLDYVIKLELPEDYDDEDGAKFEVSFTKKRVPHQYLNLLAPTIFQWDGTRWSVETKTQSKELAVLEYLTSNPKKTVRNIAVKCLSNMPQRTAIRHVTKILETLIAKGMVREIKEDKYTRYEAALDEI